MPPKTRALVTGITGQDGSYLAESLLDKGYEVHGLVRRSSTERLERIEHLRHRVTLHQADPLDQRSRVDATQTEQTSFYLRSPYGVAKAYAHFITVNYRESYDLHASSGILFNHESERRGREFVTRKITWHAAAIRRGFADKVTLGNLDAQRDWGYAKDYVEAMWMMLQQETPEDYVVATSVAHSVRDGLEIAFAQAGVDLEGHVEIDESLNRPAEVDHLIGDASKARDRLGWEPTVSFEEPIRLVVDADARRAGRYGWRRGPAAVS